HGDGVDQDYKKALAYYKEAVEARNNGTCYNLGLMYYYGKGVEVDFQKAITWFTKAVENKSITDSSHIFIQDRNKYSDDVNTHKEREYVLRKEDFGYEKAHYYLGLMYRNGYGIQQDENDAKKYVKIPEKYYIE
ncbi:HCP-like protein, partial [Backusella circina FSU 941]